MTGLSDLPGFSGPIAREPNIRVERRRLLIQGGEFILSEDTFGPILAVRLGCSEPGARLMARYGLARDDLLRIGLWFLRRALRP